MPDCNRYHAYSNPLPTYTIYHQYLTSVAEPSISNVSSISVVSHVIYVLSRKQRRYNRDKGGRICQSNFLNNFLSPISSSFAITVLSCCSRSVAFDSSLSIDNSSECLVRDGSVLYMFCFRKTTEMPNTRFNHRTLYCYKFLDVVPPPCPLSKTEFFCRRFHLCSVC